MVDSVYDLQINNLKLNDTIDLLSKYDTEKLNKLKNYITSKGYDFNDFVKNYGDKYFRFGINLKYVDLPDVAKIYNYTDDNTKKNIINNIKSSDPTNADENIKKFTNLLAEQNNIKDDTNLLEKTIGGGLEKIGSGLKWLASKDIKLGEGSPELANLIRDYSGASAWNKLYGKIYDITAGQIQNDPRGRGAFIETVGSFNPLSFIPSTAASIVEHPSVGNIALSLPVFKFGAKSVSGLAGMAAEDLNKIAEGKLASEISGNIKSIPKQLSDKANKALDKIKEEAYSSGAVIANTQTTPQLVSKVLRGELPPTTLPLDKEVLNKVIDENAIKAIPNVIEKQFNIDKFLEDKNIYLYKEPITSEKNVINKIIDPTYNKLPTEVKKWLKEDLINDEDIKKIYNMADKNVVLPKLSKPEDFLNISKELEYLNPTKETKGLSYEDAIKLSDEYNKQLLKNIDENVNIDYIGDESVKNLYSNKIKKKIDIPTEKPENVRLGLFTQTPKEAIEDKSLIKTLIGVEQKNKDYTSLADKITKAMFDQNIELAKFNAPALYRFYTEPAIIYNKAIYESRPVLEKMSKLLNNPIDESYANDYLFYNSLLEEHNLGNKWLYPSKIYNPKTGKYEIAINSISEKTIKDKLNELDKQYATFKYKVQDYNPNIHIDIKNKIDEFKAKLYDLAQDMSNVGLKLLKDTPFTDEKFIKTLENINRKYYFSYFMPEQVEEIIGKRSDINLFSPKGEVNEKLFTPYLKEREGGLILPDDDVFNSFFKGIVLKEYGLSKFDALKKTVDDIGLYADELKSGLINNPEKIERIINNISKINPSITDVEKDFIRDLLKKGDFEPTLIGYKEIRIPYVSEKNNKLIGANVYVPLPIAEFLDQKIKTFSKTIFEKTYEKTAMFMNKFQITAMLELNFRYMTLSMLSRDILDTILTSPGSLFKTTNKITTHLYRLFNKELEDPDKLLRPLFDLESIKTAFKIATSKNLYTKRAFLGMTGAYSDIPEIYQIINQETNFFKRPIASITSPIRQYMLRWETFIKSLQALRQVPKDLNIVELYEKDLGKLLEGIYNTQKNLSEYTYSKYYTSPSSMLKGITIDFRKFGSFSVKLKNFLLFLNPSIQNMRNIYLFAKNNPGTFALRYATGLSALAECNLELQRINEEYKKKYGKDYVDINHLSAYSMGKNLLIPFGTVEWENGRKSMALLSIPLPESIAVFNTVVANSIAYGFMTDSIKDEYKKHNSLTKDIEKSINEIYGKARFNNSKDAILSYMTVSLGALSSILFILGFNREGITSDKDIVPEYMNNLSTGSQYTNRNSNFAILLGDKLNISPQKIDAIAKNIPFVNMLVKTLNEPAKEYLKEQVMAGKSTNVPIIVDNIYKKEVKDKYTSLPGILKTLSFAKAPSSEDEWRTLYSIQNVLKDKNKENLDLVERIKNLLDQKVNLLQQQQSIENKQKLEDIDNMIKVLIQEGAKNKDPYLESIKNYAEKYDKIDGRNLNNLINAFKTTNANDLNVYINALKDIISKRTSLNK